MMTTVFQQLQQARKQHALVNLYQASQEIIYTGYVVALDQTAVVLDTYDDGGLRDGAVLVTLPVISAVTLSGQDLTNMAFRIKNAQLEQFIKLTPQPLFFSPQQPLLPQLLRQALRQQYFILLNVTTAAGFLEGVVQKIEQEQFTFKVFDKFDFSQQRVVTLPFSALQIVELQGKELSLAGKFVREVPSRQHCTEIAYTVPDAITRQLQLAQQKQQLVMFYTLNDQDSFYVGKVNTLNKTSVVFNLLDMNGQFGGYILLRLAEIQTLFTQADYLQMMAYFAAVNRERHFTKQPVLNDERLFDGGTDLFAALIQQARVLARVLRVRLRQSTDTFIGIPLQFDGNLVTLQDLTIPEAAEDLSAQEPVSFSVADVGELAFDYLDAYLTERQLKENGAL